MSASRELPTIRGRRVGSEGPSYPIRDYVYRGTEPFVPKKAPQRPGAICAADGCEAPHSAKGYCNKHYHRVKAHGTIDATNRSKKGENQ